MHRPSSSATTPEEIPPIHVLEAAHDQERREAEELLAGFDRPGRSPKKRTGSARDFVDHYAGREVTRTPSPGAVSGRMVIRPVHAIRVPNHFRTRVAIVLATTFAIILGMGVYVWLKMRTAANDGRAASEHDPAAALRVLPTSSPREPSSPPPRSATSALVERDAVHATSPSSIATSAPAPSSLPSEGLDGTPGTKPITQRPSPAKTAAPAPPSVPGRPAVMGTPATSEPRSAATSDFARSL